MDKLIEAIIEYNMRANTAPCTKERAIAMALGEISVILRKQEDRIQSLEKRLQQTEIVTDPLKRVGAVTVVKSPSSADKTYQELLEAEAKDAERKRKLDEQSGW